MAAQSMLTRVVRMSSLKRWALDVAKRRGMKRAKVAGPQAGRRAASHVGGRHRIPLEQGGSCRVATGKGFGQGRKNLPSEVPSPGRPTKPVRHL